MTEDCESAHGSPRSIATQVVGIAWVLMIGVVAIGHVTALRNTLTILVSLVSLVLYLRDWRALPCKAIVFALLAWATVSLCWSSAPDVTLSKLRTDFLIPLLAGAATFYFVRQAEGLRYVVAGIVFGLVALGVLSTFAYIPQGVVPANWPLEQSGGIVRPLPHWYPGPGDASMFAILAIGPLCMAWRLLRNCPEAARMRVAFVAAGGLATYVLVTTNNRNAVLVAPLVLGFQWLLDRRSNTAVEARPHARRGLRSAYVAAALVCGVIVLASILEFGARQRLTYLHRPLVGESAAIELVSADTRPMIWRYYLERGLAHPWIGFGFGRTVPGIGLKTQADRALADVEPNAYIHAHNVLLNWWLQLGVVGVTLLCAALGAMLSTARSLSAKAGRSRRACVVLHALYAVCLATLARNLTDDFLVFGMATMFCVCVAAMLGELSRLASVQERHASRASAPQAIEPSIAPRSPSAPS